MVNSMRPDSKFANSPTNDDLPLLFFAFLMADDDRRDQFMATSGLAVNELGDRLLEPHFKSFLLDYALSDEKLIVDFSTEHAVDPLIFMKARQKLPGAEFDM